VSNLGESHFGRQYYLCPSPIQAGTFMSILVHLVHDSTCRFLCTEVLGHEMLWNEHLQLQPICICFFCTCCSLHLCQKVGKRYACSRRYRDVFRFGRLCVGEAPEKAPHAGNGETLRVESTSSPVTLLNIKYFVVWLNALTQFLTFLRG